MTNAISSELIEQLSGTSSARSTSTKTIDQQEFLTLFVTQLKFQDPLSPLQPDQLTAQLAQFSSLEQLTGINTRLDTLTGSTKQTLATTLLGLVGREISFEAGEITLEGGQASEVRYTLEAPASALTATVSAADGTVVRLVELGAQEAGEHAFAFDGKTSTGTTLADGTYRVAITPGAAGGEKGAPLALVSEGIVDGVDLASDPPAVLVGGRRLTLEQVRQVRSHEPSN